MIFHFVQGFVVGYLVGSGAPLWVPFVVIFVSEAFYHIVLWRLER